MQEAAENPRLSLAALSIRDASKVLSRASGRSISVDMITADVDDGAPTNPDGTLNLIHYGAWLLSQMGRGD